jgi:hypothetical protein
MRHLGSSSRSYGFKVRKREIPRLTETLGSKYFWVLVRSVSVYPNHESQATLFGPPVSWGKIGFRKQFLRSSKLATKRIDCYEHCVFWTLGWLTQKTQDGQEFIRYWNLSPFVFSHISRFSGIDITCGKPDKSGRTLSGLSFYCV